MALPRPRQSTAYAMVRVIGVSLTKCDWQPFLIIEFIDTPDATVTNVGAVALANGTVKVCDNGCTPVLQAYEIMPSTLIVATY